ncbi:NUDIX hydrolase, partial [Escherichia coli]
MSLTELEVAERIRDGTVPSPVKFSNMWLVNLRITGTGLAYRAGLKEHVWRDPKLYLNEEFLRRCNGLPVIANHPDDAVLTEEDFKSRIVG